MRKKLLSIALAASLFVGCLGINDQAVKAADKTFTTNRWSGLNRIDTCLAIGTNYLDGSTVDNIVLATADDFPDALTGSTLAAKLGAPILLVEPTKEGSQKVLDFIKNKLNPGVGRVYLLGGTGAVTTEIEQAVTSMSNYKVTRLGGASREDTAKLIDDAVSAPQGTPVIIATENDFPDALSASSIAGIKGYPIVLTQKDGLPQQSIDVLNKVKPSKIYVVGGSGVITDNVITQAKAITGLTDSNIKRLWGSDRYATSLAIAKEFNLNTNNVVFATGENFPDALSGSALAVKNNAPIILVNSDASRQQAYIDSISASNLIFLGGSGVISDNVISTLAHVPTPPAANNLVIDQALTDTLNERVGMLANYTMGTADNKRTQDLINAAEFMVTHDGYVPYNIKQAWYPNVSSNGVYKYISHTIYEVPNTQDAFYTGFKNPDGFNDGFKYIVVAWDGNQCNVYYVTIRLV